MIDESSRQVSSSIRSEIILSDRSRSKNATLPFSCNPHKTLLFAAESGFLVAESVAESGLLRVAESVDESGLLVAE